MPGPLQGLKVIELAGLGPAPFCAMLLADMGAQVLRIERPGGAARLDRYEVTARGRPALELDLRSPEGLQTLLALVDRADVLIEGFRPGVMERLGAGPDTCLARRPALVYGRMTGWGQDGPLSQAAGHDINYIALSGALNAIGPKEGPPTVPLNLVGDFGGGAMLLAFGVLAAVLEARQSGRGQVVDAAMTDGTALLSAMMWGFRASGRWTSQREDNWLDGGAHFYRNYACADGRFIAVGALEPQFYALLMERCGIDDAELRELQNERARWPEFAGRLAALFKTRTRDEWCALLEGTDACVAPVLDWDEAPRHPHNRARGTFVEIDGVTQPAAAPRLSRTPGNAGPVDPGRRDDILRAWGLEAER
ncbi:CaiB/BaiF CoA transferase family protein [Ramlibacter rhizophilus]|uniref:CoA transferase n=1 Tax=Ramlibacter rhizophilus TaxID=1781167 RepID=A0A4Z0BUD7_9BURK|nr:CaiB/BaiF CoA-transferase family protein [Ramlibacter rhizophilus]TFZ01599.1 CoA transferase [Ramlibacter rhizophilus]